MKYDLKVQYNETAPFGNNNKRIKILIVWNEKGSGVTQCGEARHDQDAASSKVMAHVELAYIPP